MEVLTTEVVVEDIKAKFADSVLSVEQADMPVLTVTTDSLVSIVKYLYDNEEFQFRFLTTMCGLHYPFNKGKELGMMYQLHSFTNNLRLRFKIFFPLTEPYVQTLTHLYSTADWMEREAYDFYGIHFKGHKNLKRILNVDDMKDFPMRKEFPLEDPTRQDKDDTMFGRF